MKGLDALKEIKEVNYYEDDETIDEDYLNISNYIDIIEKELKALEIIKNKNVDIRGIKEINNVHEYNVKFPTTLNEFLEEQEYDLLKEVFQ